MPKDVAITCDACGKDLTYTGNSVDYRLALRNETKTHRGGGAVTAMMIYPKIKEDAYFCDLRCLREWTTPKEATA